MHLFIIIQENHNEKQKEMYISTWLIMYVNIKLPQISYIYIIFDRDINYIILYRKEIDFIGKKNKKR